MIINAEQMNALIDMGYTWTDSHDPAIQCVLEKGDTHAAPSWDDIVHYATHYELCACGVHEQAHERKRG
jgi:hypothetical protein